MRRSKSEVYLHFVWSVSHREPFLTGPVERAVHTCISDEAQSMGCVVVAIGGMPDHVHVLVKVPAKYSPSSVANQIKGVSSRLLSKSFSGCEHFAWQEDYGVFSVSRTHVDRVTDYVQHQKEHHASEKTWQTREETSEEV
jgi:putative transposase